MSVIQVEDLVSYQLRANYLTEIADGVGERLITLNENFLNSAPFKAAGWRTNPSLIKRTHSPPIPTAVASEYFQAPRQQGLTLEDEPEEGGMLASGGPDTLGPGMATKRRRRRHQMEEDDSSDLSDESDDDADQQRAAQQIKFAKMPVRHRSGSSPIQSSSLRQVSSVNSPKAPPRRGSQSALETVKERARRDTVTSSEVSSDNDYEVTGAQRQRDAARAAARAVRIQTHNLNNLNNKSEPTMGINRQQSNLLEEEEEDSDASDMSSNFNESIDSASILAVDPVDKPMQNISPTHQIVGTPPRDFKRQSTVRRSNLPPQLVGVLPPPRPLSTLRPMSMIQPRSLLSAALNAKKTKPAMPFESFATHSGQGEASPIQLRIYAANSKSPTKPFEVFIRRTVREESTGDRPVQVADLIGLALWRYNEEKYEPALPADKLNVNWWVLRMVEEGGDVDDDFPPLERIKPLASFVTAMNNKNEGARPQAAAPMRGRGRSNTKVYDDFALVQASEEEFEENQKVTPQFSQEEALTEEPEDEEATSRSTPMAPPSILPPPRTTSRLNPVLFTTYRPDTTLADAPRPQVNAMSNATRGQHKFLRIHIMTPDSAPGQMVTLDVTTDMYIEEVLDLVCRKRNLDKGLHILKLPHSGTVALLDRPVSAIGAMNDLELHKRRFGDPTLSQSPIGSSSASSKMLFAEMQTGKKGGKIKGIHPLAKEAIAQEELGRNGNYKKFIVSRKQPMRFVGANERLFIIDGEYIHIVPSSNGRALGDTSSKTTTVHFSNVVGCKLSRRHPTHFKLVVFKATESKRYDFEAKNLDDAADIVLSIKQGIAPYQ